MRDPSFYVNGLLELHKLIDASEQRATWRQSMAALARATADDGPGPLDGLHPDALVQGVRAALGAGLVDDLDWLAPPAAGAALFELASALPLGTEQRELGRRVLSRLLSGNAESFTALATRMALGVAKGLASPAARARIALVAELPIGFAVADGPLALALVSRRELAREWIVAPSTGSLPARRLAARLLERAAREASRRASQGDDHTLRVFRADALAQAWARLLADREPLVWRHVAVARGLLAPYVEAMRVEVESGLAPDLSPTEWRRAATSLAAMVAVSPDDAMRVATAILPAMLESDRGAGAAFAWGLPRAAEVEPEAAAELLDALLERVPWEVAEVVVELRTEFGLATFVERASRRTLDALGKRGRPATKDDGADALAREIARDLEQEPRDDQPLREQLARAVQAFAQDGARAAYGLAKELLEGATGTMDALDAVAQGDDDGPSGSMSRRTSLAVLRDLDISLLERAALSDLLRLAPTADVMRVHDDALDAIRERLVEWILTRESRSVVATVAASPAHPTLGLRRLRALLHVVDSDLGDAEDPARATRLRKRWLRVAHALLERFERGQHSVLRRTILATLARAIDALVRVGACDVSDVLLVVARHVEESQEFHTLAEASMDPDLIHILTRYADFALVCAPPQLKVVAAPSSDSLIPAAIASVDQGPDHAKKLKAFEELGRDLASEASGRTEALRTVLVRMHAALHAIAAAPSLRSLATADDNEPEAVASLEAALGALSQLAIGARNRLDPDRGPSGAVTIGASRPLTVAISRVLAGADTQLRDPVVAACLDELTGAIPRAIARLVANVVWGLSEIPVERPSMDSAPVRILAEALPNWLPARRTLGGFYVLRSLSSGAVGSVFVVTRVEDKNDTHAERFALKVPEYSATAARSVSESDFLKMFREEATALMAVPQHPNLARFVTFDAGARPKPILVMELVEGMSLDRVVESGAMDVVRAFRALDDVLAGLCAMHDAGVGHLDIKPSNVVMRRGEQAVLVDFGLAGRHVRPGCATGPYGAPEVWGATQTPPEKLSPMAVDVYAFGCVAFEVLTGHTLFDAETETAQVAQHIAHDGFPPKLRELAQKPGLAPVAELIFSTLRRDPKNRPTVAAARLEFQRVASQLARHAWPLQ